MLLLLGTSIVLENETKVAFRAVSSADAEVQKAARDEGNAACPVGLTSHCAFVHITGQVVARISVLKPQRRDQHIIQFQSVPEMQVALNNLLACPVSRSYVYSH